MQSLDKIVEKISKPKSDEEPLIKVFKVVSVLEYDYYIDKPDKLFSSFAGGKARMEYKPDEWVHSDGMPMFVFTSLYDALSFIGFTGHNYQVWEGFAREVTPIKLMLLTPSPLRNVIKFWSFYKQLDPEMEPDESTVDDFDLKHNLAVGFPPRGTVGTTALKLYQKVVKGNLEETK